VYQSTRTLPCPCPGLEKLAFFPIFTRRPIKIVLGCRPFIEETYPSYSSHVITPRQPFILCHVSLTALTLSPCRNKSQENKPKSTNHQKCPSTSCVSVGKVVLQHVRLSLIPGVFSCLFQLACKVSAESAAPMTLSALFWLFDLEEKEGKRRRQRPSEMHPGQQGTPTQPKSLVNLCWAHLDLLENTWFARFQAL
jgi:hypothetical protein